MDSDESPCNMYESETNSTKTVRRKDFSSWKEDAIPSI